MRKRERWAFFLQEQWWHLQFCQQTQLLKSQCFGEDPYVNNQYSPGTDHSESMLEINSHTAEPHTHTHTCVTHTRKLGPSHSLPKDQGLNTSTISSLIEWGLVIV